MDIRQIKRSVHIENVIGQFYPLVKRGSEFRGVDHDSLSVNPNKQVYGWFSRNTGGDVIDFLLQEMGMEFRDALDLIINLSGGVLPTITAPDSKPKEPVAPPKPISMRLVEKLNANLLASPAGLKYLGTRGLGQEDAVKYRLGWISDLKNHGPALIIPYAIDGIVETVRYRQVNAVGESAKYLPLYTGYGIHLYNREALNSQSNYVVIVEGEFKTMHMDKHGFPCVGIPGVSCMKNEWLPLFLKKKTVYIALDPDKSAFDFAWPRALAYIHGNVRIVNLPMKPDDLLLADGGPEYIKNSLQVARKLVVSEEDKKDLGYVRK